MKDRYEYSVSELKEIVEELIAWRDGLEMAEGHNTFAKAARKRIDIMLDLKSIEENPITVKDLK